VAVAVFRNKIYAIGGTNEWKCLNEVEVYDPALNEWSVHSHMNIARRGAGVGIHQGTYLWANARVHFVGKYKIVKCEKV